MQNKKDKKKTKQRHKRDREREETYVVDKEIMKRKEGGMKNKTNFTTCFVSRVCVCVWLCVCIFGLVEGQMTIISLR